MNIEEKGKFVATIEGIVKEIDRNQDESLSNIVNDALEEYQLINGYMDAETLKIFWEQ